MYVGRQRRYNGPEPTEATRARDLLQSAHRKEGVERRANLVKAVIMLDQLPV